MHVTVSWLREANTAAGAVSSQRCEDQLATFEAEWPDGVDVSRKSISRALELGLNVGWFISLWRPKRYAPCCRAVQGIKGHDRMAQALMRALDA